MHLRRLTGQCGERRQFWRQAFGESFQPVRLHHPFGRQEPNGRKDWKVFAFWMPEAIDAAEFADQHLVRNCLVLKRRWTLGIYIRGCLAEALGYKLDKNSLVDKSYDTIPGDDITEVPLSVVTDAKDVNDKTNSDTQSYGPQTTFAFTVCWIRSQLRLPRTQLQWTATENMLIDALTKDMDLSHLHRVLEAGE